MRVLFSIHICFKKCGHSKETDLWDEHDLNGRIKSGKIYTCRIEMQIPNVLLIDGWKWHDFCLIVWSQSSITKKKKKEYLLKIVSKLPRF